MFLRNYQALTALARPEGIPSPQAAGAAREWAQAGAHLAMSRDLPAMRLSERLADPDAYRRLQRSRRQALEALIEGLTPGAVKANCAAIRDYFGYYETGRATDAVCDYIMERLGNLDRLPE